MTRRERRLLFILADEMSKRYDLGYNDEEARALKCYLQEEADWLMKELDREVGEGQGDD